VEDNSLQPRSKASPDPPIKSAWRPPNMDMYSGCYIQNMDIYSGTYIYISILWIFHHIVGTLLNTGRPPGYFKGRQDTLGYFKGPRIL
jgi:hypothetical protein